MNPINWEQAGKELTRGAAKELFGQPGASTNLGLSKLIKAVITEFNQAARDGASALQLADAAGILGQEVGKSIREAGTPTVEEISSLAGELAKGISRKTLPYVALGTCATIGLPLLLRYCYTRAVNNLGRPKLAVETRLVGHIDRWWDIFRRTALGGAEAIRSGIRGGALVWITGGSLFFPITAGCLAYETKTGKRLITCDHEFYMKMMNRASLGCTLAISGLSLTRDLVKHVFAKRLPEPKPVFHEELAHQIEHIAKSTHSLKQAGGYFQHVLLYGTGGVGKTMVAQMIARESNMNYIFMSGGDFAQYIKRGEHVTELNKLFEWINKSRTPTILFIDEIESLCPDRLKIDKPELMELLNAFLNHTGEDSKQFMLIGATNVPQLLDPHVLTRFNYKLHIEPPRLQERKAILTQYLRRFFSEKENLTYFPSSKVSEIASKTEGFTGRTIFKMVNALFAEKTLSPKGGLSGEIIDKVVDDFVRQEKELLKTTNPAYRPRQE